MVVILIVIIVAVRSGNEVAPPAGPPVPGTAQPSPSRPTTQEGLLNDRAGFGAGVTGGSGGKTVTVTTDADSGPGSLREAVSGDEPRWIAFAQDMVITLDSPVKIGSNKTIDGRGANIEISAPGEEGLQLEGVSNVIIESLTLHNFGDVTQTFNNDEPDAVHLDDAVGVWIDHCDLSMAGDKLIGVTNGSSQITVSWNHFHDQEQVFQVGNQTNAVPDESQTVTVHHNFFDRTGYRNPVVSYGRAHVYNNYFLDWRLYAVRSERAAQMYLEDNIFDAGKNPRAALVNAGGDGCNDAGTLCDARDGYLRAAGNLLEGGTRRIREASPEKVFDPADFYNYVAETPDDELAKRIAAGAGP